MPVKILFAHCFIIFICKVVLGDIEASCLNISVTETFSTEKKKVMPGKGLGMRGKVILYSYLSIPCSLCNIQTRDCGLK